ncbi:hypothetical protein OG471_00880 [Streptomyces sp. NBC_01336]|uniref:hypothetical protein n=1 Tax=Streptomyces sp. NBC_01336 TaxID=2903829 RepID=UPI002E15B9DE|nr:hypothetical protein OG471_00880 [Streptomyces sp. NBC_01336]
MNVTQLLADILTRHEAATARAEELQEQIDHLTAALAETGARLTELDIARKVIEQTAPEATEPGPTPTDMSTAYQAIVNAFNQHPDQAFRARELHELLDMPTDEATVNVTRSRLARLLRQGFLTQPGRGRYQKRT